MKVFLITTVVVLVLLAAVEDYRRRSLLFVDRFCQAGIGDELFLAILNRRYDSFYRFL